MQNIKTVWAFSLLILSVSLLYGQFLWSPLVFDDPGFFYSSEFSHYQQLFSFDLRWLPYATFVWTRNLFGDGIIWLRLGNLLLHLGVAISFFFFSKQLYATLLPNESSENRLSQFWLAFFAALLFALHPIAVYSVGYLIQRTTLMVTLFALLTWKTFLTGLITEKRSWLYLSALFYFFGALSKEHAIMIPAVSLALYCLIEEQPLQRIKLILPTFILYFLTALFVVYQVKTRNILGQAYEPIASELMSRLGDLDKDLVYPLSVVTQTFIYFKYLWLWLIPNPMLMTVDMCQAFTTRFTAFPQLLGLPLFITYGIIAIRLLFKRGLIGLLGFALLCPWLLFFTELATVRIQEIIVLYRSYLWMIGLFISLPFLCQKLTQKQAVLTLSGIALLFIPITYGRLTTFSHPLLLWDDAARQIKDAKTCPSMDRILNNRARHLMGIGRYQDAVNDLTRSFDVLKGKEKPMVSELANNFYNRGFAYLKLQQYQLALNDFNIIVEPVPKHWADFYFFKAQAFEGLHDINNAKLYYEKACQMAIQESCEKQKALSQ